MLFSTQAIGLKLGKIQQMIVELKHRNPILTQKEEQQLKRLKQTELNLRQSQNIDLED
jgi:hypothetical protein